MPQAARLVWLDQADAQNPALVGAKAAGLARARLSGLPVLNGFVVSVGACEEAIGRGAERLGTLGNSGAARTAVFNHSPPPLLNELADAAQALSETLVVRSSSRAEAEGIWAGAFSSYLDCQPQDVAACVIGCWASVFNPGALQRAEAVGVSPTDIGMAVLVQTQVQTVWGGVATMADDHQVKIVGKMGHHAPLVAGWESGHLVTVDRHDALHRPTASPVPPSLAVRVADLARAVNRQTGNSHLEWALGADDKVHLLQVQPAPDRRVIHLRSRPPNPAQQTAPELVEVVRMMLCYPGPVGERLVWQWAIGLPPLPPVRPKPNPAEPAALLRELHHTAGLLVAQRWGSSDRFGALDRAWERLRQADPSTILELLSHQTTVDHRLAEKHLRKLAELAEALTQAGTIPHKGWMWHMDPDEIDGMDARIGEAGRRIGIGKWDPLVFGVIASHGPRLLGHPAAGGWGVGRMHLVKTAIDAVSMAPRTIIVADLPTANLAPLLWNAGGLITRGGSPAAHLFEVAQWLGVPAVCGVDLPDQRGWMVAIDGDLGEITYLPG